jgi:hypothetical protein
MLAKQQIISKCMAKVMDKCSLHKGLSDLMIYAVLGDKY